MTTIKIRHLRFILVICLTCFISLFSLSSKAWEAHFLLTYLALKNMPEISHTPTIPAETLDTFLEKEKTGLTKLLRDNEQWSQQHLTAYAPLPTNLIFTGKIAPNQSLRTAFLTSIRVNPELPYPLFLQYSFGEKHRIQHPIALKNVMIPGFITLSAIHVDQLPLTSINPGEKLSAFEIITTAADEPDYGMDIGVWENNNTQYGKLYQLGNQPFGNPTIFYSSQTPFHMGFYYESPIVYFLAGFFKRCYPEYRIHLYLTLAQYAFKTNHPYWGYRFLGWALHYLQDLSQPYHSTMAPGANLIELLTIKFFELIGITQPEQNLNQLAANRHLAFENYAYNLLAQTLINQSTHGPFLHAIMNIKHDSVYPPYSDNYPRAVVAKESHAKANDLDNILTTAFPSRYVLDPQYFFYITDPNINLVTIAAKNATPNIQKLNSILIDILQDIGSHTRNMVRYVLTQQH